MDNSDDAASGDIMHVVGGGRVLIVADAMADNVPRNKHKLNDTGGRRLSTPQHRTTTETIRLGGDAVSMQQQQSQQNNPAAGQGKKKTSSFQITSVTVGCRMSNDAGEDSNDDLDESHTEDNSVEHSSRITDLDIETPSYSEDTFSKEDVFFNAGNAALSTAPVIPTSSQYGLAIVPSESGGTSNSVNDNNINTLDIGSVTDNNIINLLSSNVKQDQDLREVHSHGRNERFKVVKIESTEPFKRGRWTCMDYLDHTSSNQSNVTANKVADPNEVCISYGVTDSGAIVPDASKDEAKIAAVDLVNGLGPQSGNQAMPMAQQPGFIAQQQQMPQYFQSSAAGQIGQSQQGSTLPTSLQSTHTGSIGQPQSMPQGTIPIINQSNNGTSAGNNGALHGNEESSYIQVNQQQQSQQLLQGQTASAPASQAANILVAPSASQQPNDALMGIQGMQAIQQNIHKVPQQQSGASQVQIQQAGSTGNQQQQVTIAQSVTIAAGPAALQSQQAFHQTATSSGEQQEQDSQGVVVSHTPAQSADVNLLESLAEVTQASDEHHTLEDNERLALLSNLLLRALL